jgi:hypothetical protein
MGKDVQPLQSVKLINQPCSRSRAAGTLLMISGAWVWLGQDGAYDWVYFSVGRSGEVLA